MFWLILCMICGRSLSMPGGDQDPFHGTYADPTFQNIEDPIGFTDPMPGDRDPLSSGDSAPAPSLRTSPGTGAQVTPYTMLAGLAAPTGTSAGQGAVPEDPDPEAIMDEELQDLPIPPELEELLERIPDPRRRRPSEIMARAAFTGAFSTPIHKVTDYTYSEVELKIRSLSSSGSKPSSVHDLAQRLLDTISVYNKGEPDSFLVSDSLSSPFTSVNSTNYSNHTLLAYTPPMNVRSTRFALGLSRYRALPIPSHNFGTRRGLSSNAQKVNQMSLEQIQELIKAIGISRLHRNEVDLILNQLQYLIEQQNQDRYLTKLATLYQKLQLQQILLSRKLAPQRGQFKLRR